MHQRIVRHVDQLGLAHAAVGGDHIVTDLRRAHRAAHHRADIDEFTRIMVDLGVGGEGRGDRAAIMFLAQRFERARIEFYRRRAFHQCEQFAAMDDDVGVRGVVALALHGRIGGHRVAEQPEQTLAGGFFQLEFLGPHPAVEHRRAAVRDMKGIDHAVTVEPVILALARRIERLGSVAIKDADQVIRDLAIDDQVGGRRLEAYGLVVPRQEWVVEKCLRHL